MAITATARLRGHLVVVDGLRGVVTAAFPSAVYVTPTRGELLVVHGAQHGPTPTSLVVDDDTALAVVPGDVVTGRANHLRVGDLVIDGRAAWTWAPPPAPRSGVSAVPVCPPNGHLGADRLDELARQLVDALRRPDAARLHAAVARLVGRGAGLTPSGDDAIVGILGVLHRCVPPAVAAAPLDALTCALVPLLECTTAISGHFLRLALRGHFGERLACVVDGCCSPRGPAPDAIARLLATGATSGADALAGIAAAGDLFRVDPARVFEEVA